MSSRWILGGAALLAAVFLTLRLFDRDAKLVEPAPAVALPNQEPESVPRPQRLEADAAVESAGREELTTSAPPPVSRIHGRLVNDATDVPLADVSLLVKRGGIEARCTTAADGAFVVDETIEPGRLSFVARLGDGKKVPLVKRSVSVKEGAPPIELRARIGPLFLIDIVGLPEAQAASWNARLVARTPQQDTDVTPAHAVEDGDPRSVRFAAPPRVLPADAAVVLVLVDDEGAWYGEGTPPALVGEPQEVIQVTVSRRGELVGRVLWEDGTPVAKTSVSLSPAGDEAWPPIAGPWTLERVDAEGRFRFEQLAIGSYHVMVAPPWRPMIHQKVFVPAAGKDLGTIELAGGGELGVVSGVLASATGSPGLAALLQLDSTDGTGWARSTIVGKPTPLFRLFYGTGASLQAGEESEVAFEIDQVPAGRYRLKVVPWDGYAYEPVDMEITAPVEGLEIVRQDGAGDFGFGFEVVDAETGTPIEEFMARFHTRLWGKEQSFSHRSGEALGRVGVGGDLSWAVFADGYAPVWGDTSSFPPVGDPRFVRVELAKGWGADFTVRDGRDPRRHYHRSASALSIPAPGAVPLPGVRVLADGEEVGVTDVGGRLRVVLDAEPERIDFVRPGWVVTPTTTFENGRVLLTCPSPKVWMVPVP